MTWWKSTLLATLVTILLLTMLTGCDSDSDDLNVAGMIKGTDSLMSQLQRDEAPEVPSSDMETLVSGNTSFAIDLYQAVKEAEGNLFFSPYSISAALAMTYAGARGNTEPQMADTLHLTLPQKQLHPAFNLLDQELTEDPVPLNEDEIPFTLNIANSIWGQTEYPFMAAFLDTLALNYGAGLRLTDFQKDPEAARVSINDWVADETMQKIKDLIPQGAINILTRLVLANAIYFKADWRFPFEMSLTTDSPFYLLDGNQTSVEMMSLLQPRGLRYAHGDGYQAIELPYKGDKASMMVIVPDEGNFEAFEAGLNDGQIREILDSLETRQVDLKMPKFTYEQDISLADLLAEMGMPDAFESKADFSGIDGTTFLYITDIFHKAFVAVDEKGTEAAAATAVIVGLKAMPQVDVQLTIDRPFIYLIQDVETKTVLFMGRVLSPAL